MKEIDRTGWTPEQWKMLVDWLEFQLEANREVFAAERESLHKQIDKWKAVCLEHRGTTSSLGSNPNNIQFEDASKLEG